MKKIILFIGLVILSFYGFSQDYSVNQLWIKKAKLTAAHSGSQHVLFINSVSGKVYSSDDVPVSNLIVSDTIFIGDSSYIVETTDTTYFSSEKNIKIGNNSLVVDRQGNVIMDDGFVVGDSLLYSSLMSTTTTDSLSIHGSYDEYNGPPTYYFSLSNDTINSFSSGDSVYIAGTNIPDIGSGRTTISTITQVDGRYEVVVNAYLGICASCPIVMKKEVVNITYAPKIVANAEILANDGILIDGNLDVTDDLSATTVTADTLRGYHDPGYRKYVAILNQQGTNNPTATVLENTLGFEVIVERANQGLYALRGPVFELFPLNKTVVFLGTGYDNNAEVLWNSAALDEDAIEIATYYNEVLSDNVLAYLCIEIRVYP